MENERTNEKVLSFDVIKELSNYGYTVGDLKERIQRLNQINKIESEQILANSNITKILQELK